jgi:hypothetical protein
VSGSTDTDADHPAAVAYLSAVQRLGEVPGIGPDIARTIIGSGWT